MNKFVVLIELAMIVTLSVAYDWHPEYARFDPKWAVLQSIELDTNPPPRPTCLAWGQSFRRRDGYRYTPGIGAHKLHMRAVEWNEARMFCEDEGGHLAVINSVREAIVMAELFQNPEPITGSPHPDLAHIGFHDLYQEGRYTTIHGQTLVSAGFDSWITGQPDNAGDNENCGSMHKNAKLNDINCAIKLGFICELSIYH